MQKSVVESDSEKKESIFSSGFGLEVLTWNLLRVYYNVGECK